MSRFTSVEEGTRLAREALAILGQASAELRPRGAGAPILMRHLGAVAVIARARALHEGAIRETLAANPPAALTVIRALVEVTAVANYLLRAPDYVELLVSEAAEPMGLRRRSMQWLIDKAVTDGHVGIGHLHAQLSDVAHFGADAAILPMRVRADEGHAWVGINTTPEWRSETHMLNALAMIEEQTLVIANLIHQYTERFITPLLDDPERTERDGHVFGRATPAPHADESGTGEPVSGAE